MKDECINSKVKYYTVDTEHAGQRLDNYLFKELKGVPKSHVYRIIRSGEVRVNKKRAKPISRVESGDVIRIPPVSVAAPALIIAAQRQDFSWFEQQIMFENDTLMVINKPSGLAVHGGSGVNLGVIELLRSLRPTCRHLELVHRLDKETSGCLLIAKKRALLKELHQLLRDKQVTKVYIALLTGIWQAASNTEIVDLPLEKYSSRGGERIVKVSAQGKAAQTVFRLMRNYRNTCLVEARPQTGRTHQIRVHATALGHPIVGDNKYGNTSSRRLMLHAKSIKFELADGSKYFFEAPLDEQTRKFLDGLTE